jgi:Skp family chaperone for outer membrane proteins
MPMTIERTLLATTLALAAGLALAPLPAARAADSLGGDPVPGVCMLSREAVFAQAKVGQAASQQLSQLATQARAQLDNQRKPLDTDLQAYQQKAASLSEVQRKQQGEALQQRVQSFQAQANQLNQRVQLTRAKAMQQIAADAQPIVATTYRSHHCGLLLDRDSVLGGNMANDLTAEVVQGLDRKVTTMSLQLEPLPATTGK